MTRVLKITAPLLAVAAMLTLVTLGHADDDQPKITLKDAKLGTHVHGPEVDADDLKGKVVVFEYWGDTCPPCVASIPHIVELKKEYGDDLVIVANQVWTKDVDRAKKAWTKSGGSDAVSVINHGAITGADHRGVPHAYIFDHEGNFIWRGNPHPRADGKEMDKTIKTAVENMPKQN